MKEKTFTNCLFDGIEAEGPHKGKRTLFVANENIDPEKIFNLQSLFKYDCIYFGAGHSFSISDKQQELIFTKLYYECFIIIEINSIDKLQNLDPILFKKEKVKIVYSFQEDNIKETIFSFPFINLKTKPHFIKLESNNQIIWIEVANVYTTSLNEHYFNYDRRIDL